MCPESTKFPDLKVVAGSLCEVTFSIRSKIPLQSQGPPWPGSTCVETPLSSLAFESYCVPSQAVTVQPGKHTYHHPVPNSQWCDMPQASGLSCTGEGSQAALFLLGTVCSPENELVKYTGHASRPDTWGRHLQQVSGPYIGPTLPQ